MKKRLFVGIFAALLMLMPLASCKKRDDTPDDTRETIDLDTSDGYDYGKLDCNKENFTFLQCTEDTWGMQTALVPNAEDAEDEVPNAVFSRNAILETLYNVTFKCINRPIYETADYVKTQCMGDVDGADVAFVTGKHVSSLLTEGMLNDISTYQDIQIYEPWWGQKIREESQFGGSSSLYYAQSDISLTAFDLTWCVAVDLERIESFGMESPYTLVDNNEWTMEKLISMAREGMTPNDDGSYTYNEGTSCVFGLITYDNFSLALLNGSACFLTQKNDLGMPAFTGTGERFSDVVEDISLAFNTDGLLKHANEDGFRYEDVFAGKRALFSGVEVKATQKFRSIKMHYGIVPVPKYNTDQATYYSNVNYEAPLLVIPRTDTTKDRTGRILDTMAYLSYKDLLPVYYTNSLSYKAIGTPEGSRMLDIIRDTRCFETSLFYGWTNDFYLELRDVMTGFSATMTATNAIRKYQDGIVAKLNDYIAGLT